MATTRQIYCALSKWSDKDLVESWTPLYDPIVTECSEITVDAFGRVLGEPYFGKFREPCLEQNASDARYYCFSSSEDVVVVYKEVTS